MTSDQQTGLPPRQPEIVTDGGPWAMHDMCCAVCRERHAVINVGTGRFSPCWECQRGGWYLTHTTGRWPFRRTRKERQMSSTTCNEPGCDAAPIPNNAQLAWCREHWPENLAPPRFVSVSVRRDAMASHYVKCVACGWQQGYAASELACVAAQAHEAAHR